MIFNDQCHHSIGHYIGREKGYVAVASDLLNREDVNHHFETVVFKKINQLAHYFDGKTLLSRMS